jgi:hypothetical protein
MNDGFRARVELVATNIVGRYARKEHKVCVETVLNGGWVNIVFEQTSVPYGPHLELGSEVCEVAAKKRKSDAGVRPSEKHVKVSGRKAMHAKASMALKGASAAPSKMVLAKATHETQASKASTVPGSSVPPRAGVLKISTGMKRLAAALSLMTKGKHARVDVRPPSASVTPRAGWHTTQFLTLCHRQSRALYCRMTPLVQNL